MAALTPGPAVLLAIRNGAMYGLKVALAGILGNISAVFVLAMLSIIGVGLLLASSNSILFWLKIVGGGYLIYLGVRSCNSRSNTTAVVAATKITPDINGYKLFGEAFMVGISNPKALLFFTALFPQFVDPAKSTISSLLPLALGCSLCSCICLIFYASISSRLSSHIQNSKIHYWFNRVIGGTFILFGIMLLINSFKLP